MNSLITIIKNQIQSSTAHVLDVPLVPDDAAILSLAQKHDLLQFIYAATNDSKNLSPIIARMMRIDYVTREVMDILEAAQIPHVPLKGAVLRSLYPEFWMRTSCDVDILVQEEDLERAVNALTNNNYRVDGKKNFHDIHLYSEDAVHLELHFNIKESIDPMDNVLDRVWKHTIPVDGTTFCYKESPEFFLFHHIAHMAYHFHRGGCGIRPFIDLWILEQKLPIDQGKYRKLIQSAGLEKFEKQAFRLMRYWFDNGEADDLILNMEHFVINGGVYGSKKQSLVIRQGQAESKLAYFFNRLIMPYKFMVILYPVLKKHKWLMPFCQVHRWGKAVGARKRVAGEVQMVMTSKEDYSVDMMKELGL